MSLRPERVEFDTNDSMDNIVNGRIEELIYLGDHIRVRMNVAGNDEFIIKTRNAPDVDRLTPGQQIEIGWLPQDCRALDA